MIKCLVQSPNFLSGEKGKTRYKNELEGTISVSWIIILLNKERLNPTPKSLVSTFSFSSKE